MLYKAMKDGFLARLERGDELLSGLRELMRRESIGCGSVTGLGAVHDPRLGYYVLEEKRYIERRFEGEWEVCGLTGSLSWFDGDPFPHVHLVLTGPDFRAIGGHLFAALAAATVELRVSAEAERVERRIDPGIGLHLMDLPESCPIGPRPL